MSISRTLLLLISFCFLNPNAIAHPPWSIAFDEAGNLYIPDIASNGRGTLWKITPKKELIPLLKDFHCHSVSFVPGKGIYSAHGEEHHLLVRIDGLQIDTVFNESDYEQFFGGNCTVSPNGRTYFVAQHYVWEKQEDGTIRKVSDQYLEWTQSIYVDANETIYVPDIGVMNGSIYEIDRNGNSVCIASDLISKLGRPRDRHNDVILGIQKDPTGHLYLAEKAGRRIIKIDSNGHRSTFYQSTNQRFPTAICFNKSGVFILEYDEALSGLMPIINRINTDGSVTEYFNMSDYH